MDTRKGGHRYCPNCKKVVETRVLLEGYCQTEVHGTLVNARSFAEQTLKVQAGAGQNGLRWRYWRINYDLQLEREGELMKKRFLALHEEEEGRESL
jgi:hypothetical protein